MLCSLGAEMMLLLQKFLSCCIDCLTSTGNPVRDTDNIRVAAAHCRAQGRGLFCCLLQAALNLTTPADDSVQRLDQVCHGSKN